MLKKYTVQLSVWVEVDVNEDADKWDIEAEAIKVFKQENDISKDIELSFEMLDHFEN